MIAIIIVWLPCPEAAQKVRQSSWKYKHVGGVSILHTDPRQHRSLAQLHTRSQVMFKIRGHKLMDTGFYMPTKGYEPPCNEVVYNEILSRRKAFPCLMKLYLVSWKLYFPWEQRKASLFYINICSAGDAIRLLSLTSLHDRLLFVPHPRLIEKTD